MSGKKKKQTKRERKQRALSCLGRLDEALSISGNSILNACEYFCGCNKRYQIDILSGTQFSNSLSHSFYHHFFRVSLFSSVSFIYFLITLVFLFPSMHSYSRYVLFYRFSLERDFYCISFSFLQSMNCPLSFNQLLHFVFTSSFFSNAETRTSRSSEIVEEEKTENQRSQAAILM